MIDGISKSESLGATEAIEVSQAMPAPENGESVNQENSEAYKLSLSKQAWKELGSESEEFNAEDQRKIEELKKADKNVHIHEQAHLNAAGGYARGGAHYSYVTGPDGKKYANSGYVNLDTSKENTPEATIKKANVIHKAALAPADPSPSDRQIASDAAKMAVDAQKELAIEQSSME